MWVMPGHSADDGCWVATCRLCGHTQHVLDKALVCPLCRYGSLSPYPSTPTCLRAGCVAPTASEVVPRIHAGCVEHTRAAKLKLNGIWTTVGALVDHRMTQLANGELPPWVRLDQGQEMIER